MRRDCESEGTVLWNSISQAVREVYVAGCSLWNLFKVSATNLKRRGFNGKVEEGFQSPVLDPQRRLWTVQEWHAVHEN